jgi:hypothetical protein
MISAEEQNLRVPKLVHHLLLLQVVTTLSEPRCNLHNARGTRTVQGGPLRGDPEPRHHTARPHQGDEVEVEPCGPCFDAPRFHEADFPCLVRRLAWKAYIVLS